MDILDPDMGWLTIGGARNEDVTNGAPFLVGDFTLDGIVDGLDFLEWNENKFTNTTGWCQGDFDSDGTVDGLDFIAWNGNKFTASDTLSVPEPTTVSMAVLLLITLFLVRRN